MASKISWIEAIPEDAREELIHDLSENKQSDLVPLQINDNVYWIPMEVNMLITALEEQEVQDLDPLQNQMHNPGHIEDKLVNKWKKDEGSGLKGWLEENISKKGMKRSLDKAAAYQKKGMSKEVVPGVTQGDLYSGLTAGTASTGIKVSKYIPSMLKAIGQRGTRRSIVAVEMEEKGKKFIQPFYKSSGTSGVSKSDIASGKLAERGGEWMPFLGKSPKGGYFKDTSGIETGRAMPQGWFIKGHRTGAGGEKMPWTMGGAGKGSDIQRRLGATSKVSKQISELEAKGYFKEAGTVRTPTSEKINKWLEGYGFKDRPKGFRPWMD